MSGTSFDAVDVSLIETDGKDKIFPIHQTSLNYTNKEREIYFNKGYRNFKEIKKIIDSKHIKAIKKIIAETKLKKKDIDLISLHGQTLSHNPKQKWTWQYCNSELIKNYFKIKVVSDFRLKDINSGGEGAPLVPIYHYNLVKDTLSDRPIGIINIGGISNITVIDKSEKVYGFDIGPGNGPLDSIIFNRLGANFDNKGNIARSGKVNQKITRDLLITLRNDLSNRTFDRKAIDDLCIEKTKKLSTSSALASLSEVIATIFKEKLKKYALKKIILTGGGRKNLNLVDLLKKKIVSEIIMAEDVGWDGDGLEAQAFAYLGVRSLLGLNITYNTTTGIRTPASGGVLFNVSA